MYSIILSEDVVNAVDRLAAQSGLNRSAFIDGVLAEYCNLTTPAMMVSDIFDRLDELFRKTPFFVSRTPNSGTMTLMGELRYRYRPMVKYDVVLGYGHPPAGRLRVSLRSQNAALLRDLRGFFVLVNQTEQVLLSGGRGQFEYEGGKFVRPIVLPPQDEYTAEETAAFINGYIVNIDLMLADYLEGKYGTARDFAADYAKRFGNVPFVI